MNSSGDDFEQDGVAGKFLDGVNSSRCNFYVKDDTKAEGNETFVVQLSLAPGNSNITSPTHAYIKIIANDDAYGVVGFAMVSSELLV